VTNTSNAFASLHNPAEAIHIYQQDDDDLTAVMGTYGTSGTDLFNQIAPSQSQADVHQDYGSRINVRINQLGNFESAPSANTAAIS
jgi:hypothetical protein